MRLAAALALTQCLMLRRLKSSGSGEPYRSSQGPSLAALLQHVAKRASESREGPPAEDTKVSPPGIRRRKADKPAARGMPVSPVRSRSIRLCTFYPFVQRAVAALLALAASRAPSELSRAISSNPGANRSREEWRLSCLKFISVIPDGHRSRVYPRSAMLNGQVGQARLG